MPLKRPRMYLLDQNRLAIVLFTRRDLFSFYDTQLSRFLQVSPTAKDVRLTNVCLVPVTWLVSFLLAEFYVYVELRGEARCN